MKSGEHVFHLKAQGAQLRAQGVPVWVDDDGHAHIGTPPAEIEGREPAGKSVARQMEADLAMASRLGCDYFTFVRARDNSPPEWYWMMYRVLIRQQRQKPGATAQDNEWAEE